MKTTKTSESVSRQRSERVSPRWRTALPALACLALAGCATPARFANPTMPSSRPIETADPAYWYAQPAAAAASSQDFDALAEACQAAARTFFFPIDRLDYRGGVIQTEPVVSGQWFEPWRRAQQTAADVAQSSLGTVRRTLRFEITRGGSPESGWTAVPKVLVERESLAERRITTSLAYNVLLRRDINAYGTRASDLGIEVPSDYFYPTGRDPAMERKLAEVIKSRLAKIPQ